MWGVLERNNNILKAKSAKNRFSVSLESIIEYAIEAQKSKMDAHILIGGQNGLGKSYLQLAMAKTFLRYTGQKEDFGIATQEKHLKFFFAQNTKKDLMEAIKEHQRAAFIIDELRPLFDYKRSMTIEQTALYNLVEVARSHGNIFIGASRDYTKLDINYRNAKAQILIYLIDKVLDTNKLDGNGFYPTKFSYGAVFVGNPALEYEDKFQFSQLRGYSIETTKYLAEKLHTWVGNIVVKHVKHYGITPNDLRVYEEEKEKGIKTYKYERITTKRKRGVKNEA